MNRQGLAITFNI